MMTGQPHSPDSFDAIELSLFASRIDAVCEEMGTVLRRTAFSANIKERLDYSCAVFDADGELCAQAAHIPVHLGSMAYAMRDLVRIRDWRDGEMLIVNDPFNGGTHLPDVTVIAPLFAADGLLGFVANRAHHADIGCGSPGSMPLSTTLADEGLVITPQLLVDNDGDTTSIFDTIVAATRNAEESAGDLHAQIAANRAGLARLSTLISPDPQRFLAQLGQLNSYAETIARHAIDAIPDGCYRFTDTLEGDGSLRQRIQVSVDIRDDSAVVDFTGTSVQNRSNLNCPLPVTAAAVYYVFRCLMPAETPACAGSLRPILLIAQAGTLVNARPPAAVAAGNVETSTRITDALLGALAQALPEHIPAASQGSMNNVALGSSDTERPWDYYETIGGGMGAGPQGDGLDACQTHMTNTLNTPIEVLESRYPMRITRYAVRVGSGGDGQHRGGDGLIREFEFLAPGTATVISERRHSAPWGLAGGEPGAPGQNLLNDTPLAGSASVMVGPGDRLRIETAGGGGWGEKD